MNSKPSDNAALSALSQHIKTVARELGFSACGIARAEAVDAPTAAALQQWLDSGGPATMHYMSQHTSLRLDPRLLMPEAESIVCVALNYAPAVTPPPDEYQFAAYALGRDYHDIVKQKLHQLAAAINLHLSSLNLHPSSPTFHPSSLILHPFSYRAFCDSAPILERYWAERAGIGWIGRNHQLIIPHAGSMFFLGELLLNVPLAYDAPMPNRCGTCHACIDACPTAALSSPTGDADRKPFDASRCLSYQTIENREALSPLAASTMGNTIYGCDRCQQACPWNRFAQPNTTPELQPSDELLGMTREQWHQLSEDDYRRLFRHSAVKRAKYNGLKRNIDAARQEEEKHRSARQDD